MDNKDRNKIILELTCELLEKLNHEVENAFVEDVEGEDNQVLVSLTVVRPGALIGLRGRNLAAIQLVLSLMVKVKFGEWVRVLLDINNYREEQKERLQNMAKDMAKQVLSTGQIVEMMAMSSYERRLCHIAIQDIEEITSESEGEGEMRHLVIKKV